MLKRITDFLEIHNSSFHLLSLVAISFFFINVGFDHFINPNFYLRIMPDYLPLHAEAVYLSGFFEILGGICVLHPRLRWMAGQGLILLLIAVFPANIHMAINPQQFSEIPLALLYFRLVLQFILILWVFKTTKPLHAIN